MAAVVTGPSEVKSDGDGELTAADNTAATAHVRDSGAVVMAVSACDGAAVLAVGGKLAATDGSAAAQGQGVGRSVGGGGVLLGGGRPPLPAGRPITARGAAGTLHATVDDSHGCGTAAVVAAIAGVERWRWRPVARWRGGEGGQRSASDRAWIASGGRGGLRWAGQAWCYSRWGDVPGCGGATPAQRRSRHPRWRRGCGGAGGDGGGGSGGGGGEGWEGQRS